MQVTMLLAAERHAVAWRNGGGITREVAASPGGATLAAFDWRVSMAEIQVPGPFSRFDQVDRLLFVVDGTLALTIGADRAVLTPSTPGFGFAGEADCHGAPLGGPVLDLNVMLRRDEYAAMARRIGAGPAALTGETALFVALAPSLVTIGAQAWPLAAHDALRVEKPAGAMTLQGDGLLITFQRRTP